MQKLGRVLQILVYSKERFHENIWCFQLPGYFLVLPIAEETLKCRNSK